MAAGKIIITVTGFNCLAYKADHIKFAITLPFGLYTQFMNLSCSYNCLLFQPNAIQYLQKYWFSFLDRVIINFCFLELH